MSEQDAGQETPMKWTGGVDVSSYQSPSIWTALANAGRTFGMIKLTEGSTIADKHAVEHWRQARANGCRTGVYHFFTTSAPVVDQFNWLMRQYDSLHDDAAMPIAIDCERGVNGQTPSLKSLVSFAQMLYTRTTRWPRIYVSPATARQLNTAQPGAAVLGQCGLWVAHWGVEQPTVPQPWKAYDIWQPGKGSVPGVEVELDLDIMLVTA